MIVTDDNASLRQAGGHVGDNCDNWKLLQNDVADVAGQTGTVRERIGRVEMSSAFVAVADQSPYSHRLLRAKFLYGVLIFACTVTSWTKNVSITILDRSTTCC